MAVLKAIVDEDQQLTNPEHRNDEMEFLLQISTWSEEGCG